MVHVLAQLEYWTYIFIPQLNVFMHHIISVYITYIYKSDNWPTYVSKQGYVIGLYYT